VSAGTCTKGSDVLNWLTKVAAKRVSEDVKCKDGSECPEGSTCCEMSTGQYGCCPLAEVMYLCCPLNCFICLEENKQRL
jgi:progranulin